MEFSGESPSVVNLGPFIVKRGKPCGVHFTASRARFGFTDADVRTGVPIGTDMADPVMSAYIRSIQTTAGPGIYAA